MDFSILQKHRKLIQWVIIGVTVVIVVVVWILCSNKLAERSTEETAKHEDVNVTDMTGPVIKGDDVLTVYKNDTKKISDYYEISDDSSINVKVEVEGECDTTILGSCNLRIVATDQAGNKTIKDIVVNVVANPAVEKYGVSEYYIRVNRTQNVVMVYALDENGEYSGLVKTFVSSNGAPGSETIIGTYTIANKYESLLLVGNVWGHYATQIDGPYLFHSVPYYSPGNPHWDDLEYEEYNKLGEAASAGCVRLAVIDAKWIYDNVAAGTTVEIYDADTLPDGVVKPEAIKIDVNSANRGWDPTDPDPENPWK